MACVKSCPFHGWSCSVEEAKEAKDAEETKENVAAAVKGALAKLDVKKVCRAD